MQVKIWFQNRRMKWRNSKERELLSAGGSRDVTLPGKDNPHPDLSDALRHHDITTGGAEGFASGGGGGFPSGGAGFPVVCSATDLRMRNMDYVGGGGGRCDDVIVYDVIGEKHRCSAKSAGGRVSDESADRDDATIHVI